MDANSNSFIEKSQLPILIVEDEADIRCLLQREIADQGYPVVAVGDAERALVALQDRLFAVVVTDICMPGIDGVTLTQRIKQQSPATEVILVTGYASIETASQAVRLGAFDYLTKPFGNICFISECIARAAEKFFQGTQARAQLNHLQAQQTLFARVLDHFPMGVVLIDDAGKVLLENQHALAIFAQGDGLSKNSSGRLLGARSDITANLRALIKDAVEGLQGQGIRQGGAMLLPRPSGRPSYSALVMPLKPEEERWERGEPASAVFVSDPEQRAGTAEDLLCRLYALTPTEARLAAILMQGKSVEDAMFELNVSSNTARTHLKRIFVKTNTTHQGDLISLLFNSPALLKLKQESP
jgi:FixJ family two-component response regulator